MGNNSPEQIDKDGCGLKPLIPIAFALCIKKEYDFFKGARGTFCRPDAELYLPIYLERNTMEVGSGLRRLFFIAVSIINSQLPFSLCPLHKRYGCFLVGSLI